MLLDLGAGIRFLASIYIFFEQNKFMFPAKKLAGSSNKKNCSSKSRPSAQSQVLYGSTVHLCSYLVEGVHSWLAVIIQIVDMLYQVAELHGDLLKELHHP